MIKVIIAVVLSMLIISQEINQHSRDLMIYQQTTSIFIADSHGITAFELDVQKAETAAKEPQVDTIKPYLPAQLGPKS